MKYILLVYSTEDAWSPEEKVVSMAESVALCHELHARQQYLGASPLHPASTAACIRYEDGRQLVIDGPFIDTHDQLPAGFVTDAGGRARRVQWGGPQIRLPCMELMTERDRFGHAHHYFLGTPGIFGTVDQQNVFHGDVLARWVPALVVLARSKSTGQWKNSACV